MKPPRSLTDFKVHENRLRRLAQREGLQLVKSRSRTVEVQDWGQYMLVNEFNTVETHGWADIGVIEEMLEVPADERWYAN